MPEAVLKTFSAVEVSVIGNTANSVANHDECLLRCIFVVIVTECFTTEVDALT
jgi:hypothetical protein